MKQFLVIALALIVQAVSGSAAAQVALPVEGTLSLDSNSTSGPVAPQRHRYSVRARMLGRRLEVRSLHDVPIARCVSGCWLELPNGEYTVVFYDAAAVEHVFEFTVSGPGGIELEDPDEGAAAIGLGFGIAGAGIVAAGTVLFAVGASRACIGGECADERKARSGSIMALSGLGALVVGGIMAPIGFVTWARNRNPRLHQDAPGIELAVAPTSNGVFLGLSGNF